MGLLNLFSKTTPTLPPLPAGSFTVDRGAAILASTVPSSFPPELVEDLAQQVLACFREAAEAREPLSELHVSYPSLKLSAREMRGGAILFLSPQTPYAPTK
jgi:hypothetical protein